VRESPAGWAIAQSWPGHIKAGSNSNAMFSIVDFYPTFASIRGAKIRANKTTNNTIDSSNQSDLLRGVSAKFFVPTTKVNVCATSSL